MLNFLKNLSAVEIAVIALILIVFFGSKAITKLARISGQTLKEVKGIKKNFTDGVESKPKNDKKEVSK